MTSVRLRRLQSDYEAVRRLARLHPKIRMEGASGNPPDRYRLILKVRSLREKDQEIQVAGEHRMEITLPGGYPRDPPLCRMLTPVFHPNIAPHAVCIGDAWSAAESLDLMIQRVGEMLAFQRYNTKSPLNGHAAQWAEENLDRLPIDPEEFFIDLRGISDPGIPQASACSNCGSAAEALETCEAGHRLCLDCAVRCETCGKLICLICGKPTCHHDLPAAESPPPIPPPGGSETAAPPAAAGGSPPEPFYHSPPPALPSAEPPRESPSVPPPSPPPLPGEEPFEVLEVTDGFVLVLRCGCGAKVKAPHRLKGSRGRCPKCSAVRPIPAEWRPGSSR